jgi:hypothetical protein
MTTIIWSATDEKGVWSQQLIETRLETPGLGYDHIPVCLTCRH